MESASRIPEKLFFRIGEVCDLIKVQPHVLRYWETEFPALAPNKSGGGQRLYSQREIDTILRIKQLLYAEGFTIAGAKKKLEEGGGEVPVPNAKSEKPKKDLSKALNNVRKELKAILQMLSE